MTTLTGNEIFYVVGEHNDGSLSPIYTQVTTQQVANLGNGVTYSNQIINYSSNNLVVTSTGTIVAFDNISGVAKTCTIPTSSGSLRLITVLDLYGDAGTNNITIQPVTGSITGPSVINSNYASITLVDMTIGWVSI